jgi:hypothetical protein
MCAMHINGALPQKRQAREYEESIKSGEVEDLASRLGLVTVSAAVCRQYYVIKDLYAAIPHLAVLRHPEHRGAEGNNAPQNTRTDLAWKDNIKLILGN